MFRKLADVLLTYPKFVVAAIVVLAAAAAVAVPYLEFNFTPQQMFRTTEELEETREEFAERFGREDNLTVIMVVAEGDRTIYEPRVLAEVHELTIELRERGRRPSPDEGPRGLASLEAAESLTTVTIPRSSEPGVLQVGPLVELPDEIEGEALDEDTVSTLRERAEAEPLIEGRFVSEDAAVTPIMVWFEEDVQAATELEAIVDQLDALLERYPLPEGYHYEIAGIPSIRVDVVESLRSDQLTFLPLLALTYTIILLLMFRSASGVLLPQASVAFTLVATVALLVLTDHPVNIVNNVLPALVFIIGISDSIHMLTRQAEEVHRGASHTEGIRAMVRHTGLACLLTSSTTAIGFISLLAADTQILRDFGWQAAAGVMFAYLMTVLFIPSGLNFLSPVRLFRSRDEDEAADVPGEEGGQEDEATDNASAVVPAAHDDRSDDPFTERVMHAIGVRVLDHPIVFTVLSLAVLAVAGFFAGKVEINTYLLDIYGEEHPSYRRTKRVENQLGGFLPIEVSLQGEPGAFSEPENYEKLVEAQEDFAQMEETLSTQSMADFHQAARAALLGDPGQRDVMPENEQQIRQIHTLIEGAPDEMTGVRRFVTPDFSHARILVRIRDHGAKTSLEMGQEMKEELRGLFGPKSGIDARLTGDAYVASVSLDSFVRDLFYSLLLAIIIIFGVMSFVFRSIKLGLISMIPNVIPLIITSAYMGLVGIDLNTSTIIVFAISLGLAVDDTIHFLARFQEELPRHLDVRRALLATYRGTGRAILLTSALLVTGLSILLLSDFLPTQRFGLLCSITIAAALIGDLVLLPPVLLLAYRGKKEQATAGVDF
jgi:hypothetical protein